LYKLLLLAAATLSLAFTPAPFPRPSRSKKELNLLQGEWVRIQTTLNGKPTQSGPMTVLIVGDRMTVLLPTRPRSDWRITLDATKDLKVFDFTGLPGPAKGHAFPGVYRLEGDTLTICSSTKGAASHRPTNLDGGGDSVLLQVFKRAGR
jgi:uncharacterized protein (TIGR03067 family)